MKVALKYIIALCMLFVSMEVSAHKPDVSSTLLVEQEAGKWILQIRAALTGFEYEIETHFGESSYTSPEEFQELVVKHVRENMIIRVDENKGAVLKNGIVKLGHETSVSFELEGMPSSFETIEVHNSSFKNISRNQSALIVLKKDFAKKQYILNNDNQHTVILNLNNGTFELVLPTVIASTRSKSGVSIYFLVGSLMLLLVLFTVFRAFKKEKSWSEQA